MSTEFAMDLRLARRKAGFTQRDCAHLLEIPQSRFSAFENGTLLPSIDQLVLLALIFDRNFGRLYEELAVNGHASLKARISSLPNNVRRYAGTINRRANIERLMRRLQSNPDDHGGA